MQQLGDRVAGARSMFADVAILGPVAWHGASTPLMVSDVGAPVVAGLLQPAKIDVLDEPPGSAMAHKLLRSVFMKGLASLIVEAADAGRAAGFEPWVRDQVSPQLAGDGQPPSTGCSPGYKPTPSAAHTKWQSPPATSLSSVSPRP